jgi:hypothetical protein
MDYHANKFEDFDKVNRCPEKYYLSELARIKKV